MNRAKNTMNVMGIITGILSIVFAAIIKFESSHGDIMFYETYNGDAYTSIQNAAAQTATNVYNNSEILSTGFAMILFILGLALVFHFGAKLAEDDTPSYTPRYASYESPRYTAPEIKETTHPLTGKVTTSDGDWICTKCGSRNPSGKIFCKDCGETK